MNSQIDTFNNIVAHRRSLRAFLPRTVAREKLEAIFSTALKAPSNCNTQPWLVHVVSGTLLETLRQRMPDAFLAGKSTIDFPYGGSYTGVYRKRQHGAAQALYDAAGINREQKIRRQQLFLRNYSFFDAPHVAFLFLPEPFGLREAADLGMFAQTLMLGLTAHGLGSCPQTSLSFQADLVREVLSLDVSNKLVFGISFGFPDPEAAINSCHTSRAALADSVRFHS